MGTKGKSPKQGLTSAKDLTFAISNVILQTATRIFLIVLFSAIVYLLVVKYLLLYG